ncbi:hypothetical protein JNB71_22175 [Rhizobium herbae]|uniref:Uncharacterized protein n=1 Tax=Rhizobium herbae TaxID=508661 RepID=A0ABS7HFZ4_9HYPH|nr:hypothetical protein [Rhizobium herbae]MBW9066018.1 hypothetical protein [Rhizobium herbae]
MERLSASTPLPAQIEGPCYDRAALNPGILHIGLRCLHRADQAVYTDRALAESFGDWGIVGVSLRSLDAIRDLRAQHRVEAAGTDIHASGSANARRNRLNVN